MLVIAEPDGSIPPLMVMLSLGWVCCGDDLIKKKIPKVTNEYTTVYNPNTPNEVGVYYTNVDDGYRTMNSGMWHFEAKIGAMTMKVSSASREFVENQAERFIEFNSR
jgi:hypothetical protein